VDASTSASLLVEILFTFALALVVLNVATSSKTTGNSYYGLAIGFTIMVGAFAGGGISGGAFNPAVGVGLNISQALLGAGSLGHTWLYIVGPLIGAIGAAYTFKVQERS
jgi:aquaporin Z